MCFWGETSEVGGVEMVEGKGAVSSDEDEIARYHEMSAQDVQKELCDAGIEPALAVAAVKKLIREKLERKNE